MAASPVKFLGELSVHFPVSLTQTNLKRMRKSQEGKKPEDMNRGGQDLKKKCIGH